MEDGNMENNDSPLVTKKLRTMEERPSSSSSSDAHNEPQKASSGDDDGGDKGEDDFGLSAGSFVPQVSQGRSDPVPITSLQDVAPDGQKAEQNSSAPIESSQAPAPAVAVTIELPTVQHDYRLHVVPNGVPNSGDVIMPSRMGDVPDQPARNFPSDQSIRGSANFPGPVSMHETQNNNYNFPMPHLSTELRMDYSQVPNLNLQTQTGDGFAARAQWAEWIHLQQQLALHDPSMLSRLQDIQGQGNIPRDGVFTENGPYATGAPPFVQHPSNISQQGLGDHNILSSTWPTFDPVLVPANFTGALGILGPNLEANRLTEEREPFGHSQMNAGYIDLIHPGRSPQLAARPVSPVQVNQGRNRIPVPNSIYDPMYESLGLPVDPHLRLFLASQRDSGR